MRMIHFIENDMELEKARKMDNYFGVTDKFMLRALPHGNFFSYYGKGKEFDTVKMIEFERKLPKISRTVLEKIVRYFKSDLSKEMVVRIFYSKSKNEYFYVSADGNKQQYMIEYDFSNAIETMLDPDNIMVIEIHSHNTMDAYFSEQDNSDEIYPGLFGVIGRLDEPVVSIKCRAGADGLYTDVLWEEIFE